MAMAVGTSPGKSGGKFVHSIFSKAKNFDSPDDNVVFLYRKVVNYASFQTIFQFNRVQGNESFLH